jgi:hypothetical protein
MADDPLQRQLAELDRKAKTRYGDDNWQTAVDAVGRAAGSGGIPEQAMKQVLATDDPSGLIYNAAKEQLLIESDSGNRESEYKYAAIRQKEREAYRKLRGR